LNTQNNQTINEQLAEQGERNEQTRGPVGEKKPFVEPAVSVPVDVLEATTFFQTPTIEGASV
jgi:hypothetical protein